MFNKIVGITNKTIKHPDYPECLDSLDLKWIEFLINLKLFPVSLCTIPPKYVDTQIQSLNIKGIILSGGHTPSNKAFKMTKKYSSIKNNFIRRDLYEISLVNKCIKRKLPILGVCRGLQLLNIYFGGKLTRLNGHDGKGKHKIINYAKNSSTSFARTVNSYHNYGVEINNLGSSLIPLAFDNEGNIEAFKHKKKKIMGIMWHPEREINFKKNDSILFEEFFK